MLLGACPERLGTCTERWDNFTSKLLLRVPMNITYMEARYERMIVIALGNLIANSITGAQEHDTVFSQGALGIMCATPLIMFYCKVN